MNQPACKLFIRHGCHLCEDMLQQLLEFHGELPVNQLEIIDVDSSAQWQRDYGERVPVLVCGQHIICEYFFDPLSYKQYLNGQQGGL